MVRHDGLSAGDQQQSSELGRLIGDSRAGAYGILISRITGFGRIAAAGAVLGPTFFGNISQTALVLPSTIYGLLVGTLISALLVPPLVQRINAADRCDVSRFANAALGQMTAVLLCVAVLTVVASPLLLRAMTSGVGDPEVRQFQLALGGPLLLTLIPQIPLYGIVGAGMAVQQAHGRFALAFAAPAIENVVIIAVLCAFALLFGVGTDASDVSPQMVLFLGFGTTSGVVVHACVQWIGAYRLGIALMPAFDWRDPALWQVVRKWVSSAGFNALYWLAYIILLVMAGGVPGGVAAFQLAYNFCQLPVALIAIPVATAQLPRLSAYHQRETLQEFRAIYRNGLRLTNFAVAPAALLLLTIPQLLAAASAFGAIDTPAAISMIALCIGSLGLGVIGESMFMLATLSCYARQDAVGPFHAMVIRLFIFCLGAATTWAVGPSGHQFLWVLGGSLTVANLAAGVYLNYRFQRGLPSDLSPEGIGLLSGVVVAALSVMPAISLSRWLAEAGGPAYRRAAIAVAALGLTMVVYFALQLCHGSSEARLLLAEFKNIRLKHLAWRGQDLRGRSTSPAAATTANLRVDGLPK